MKRSLAVAMAIFLSFAAADAFALPNGWPNGNVASYPAGSAANGIAASRHNLGAFSSFNGTTLPYGTTEICVFCHTPHHTNTSVRPAPLWNRVNVPTYTAYGTTIGGSVINAVNPVSQACLSCHDGVTSFDNIINAPGAGGVNPAGSIQNWSFALEGDTATGFFRMPPFTTGLGEQRLNIGTTLSNDHPMSVIYEGDGPNVRASLRPRSAILSSIDLTTGLQPSAVTIFNGNLAQNRWAIKGYISNTATIADLLRGPSGTVECSSCHDPHFKNTSWDEIENSGGYAGLSPSEVDGLFLRRVGGNAGSGVCRTCHNK